jgi:hypothetical protein
MALFRLIVADFEVTTESLSLFWLLKADLEVEGVEVEGVEVEGVEGVEVEGVEVEDEANEFSIPRFLRDGGPGFVTTWLKRLLFDLFDWGER